MNDTEDSGTAFGETVAAVAAAAGGAGGLLALPSS